MKILIIGGGGREHALAYKVAQSPLVEKIFVAPGNPGVAEENMVELVDLQVEDLDGLLSFALKEEIGLTIIGPEQPLVLGITDLFEQNGLKVFGPSKGASQLEGSKSFSKDFLAKYKIPTAKYKTFEGVDDIDNAIDYINTKRMPIVIKADGLAAGKGVIISTTKTEARDVVFHMLRGDSFGSAGNRIVIEDFLKGEEASFIVMVDGENVIPFATSQDHKRAYDNDEGPNTGGMGAYSPAPVVTPEIHQAIMKKIIYPTVKGMQAEGLPYKGFLYAGLMISEKGLPKVIEFNCRFGDPETQPIMMRLESDLVELCLKACDGKLDDASIEFKKQAALGVVLASGGYPGEYEKKIPVVGLDYIAKATDTKVFHAGTKFMRGCISTDGGRILCVTSLGDTVKEAQTQAYKQINKISCKGSFFRRDIGDRAIDRE
jgi:phosphoribosylamine--glycine ligase